ncbi:hypothetical protein SERLA73DRAFT_70804 [Serpula lacrymans var. lacrymans S7.3]|uniref:Uncharacterized protein n=2 Tax=Serpula lacrymans var. lacrymans TaxID=341189 RepID=F8PQS4_SERL3|nr:uncharacterized protein SERLADRAFT_435055 [Serpula lacrymans var. lacrymans S7.9]EGO01634.1 hypothetical protein SERLA73DRAFT_70804 [Serpula lacrymans var. lacrymans S7.3]EGO27289.1 hypothetical protein SERLADRAFT_435055 [Serpula lacrymans var. lacrymans S7.9]
MSTSHSTGFPITTYSVPGGANMLANEQLETPTSIYFTKQKNTTPMCIMPFLGKQAFAAQQSRLEYLLGTPDGKVSFGIFGTTLENELLEWADRRGKGIFGIRWEDLANKSVHAVMHQS